MDPLRPSRWERDPQRDAFRNPETGEWVPATSVFAYESALSNAVDGELVAMSSSYASGVSNLAQASVYPTYGGFSSPGTAMWHNFPCGHQLKLEPGQPPPGRCPSCPAPEMLVHEYKRCGHVHNYTKGQVVPAECPLCSAERAAKERAAREAAEQVELERQRRAEEAKDPLAWLDKSVESVRERAFARA